MMKKSLGIVLSAAVAGCAAPVGDGGVGAADAGSSAREPTPLEQGLDTVAIAGNVRLYLTDAPGEFDEVWVDVSRVEISAGDGGESAWQPLAEGPITLDLLSLQNDVTAVLGDAALAAGSYGQIRFLVADAWVVAGGEQEALTIPSGAQTGIKIDLGLTVEEDTVYAVVLDFDAGESIHRTGAGELKMAPVIKLEYVGVVGEDGVTPLDDGAKSEGDAGDADGAGDAGDADGAGDVPDGAGGQPDGAGDVPDGAGGQPDAGI